MPQTVVIVGGGASGLFTSILLKDANPELDVIVLERLERVGKKILATGSGKGNLANAFIKPNNVSGYNDNEFVAKFVKKYPLALIKKAFLKIGILITELKDGRIYPKSESANSILDAFRLQMRALGVKEECNFEVKRITKQNDKYVIESTRNLKIEADYVIMSFGGKSSPMLGSNGTGFDVLKKMKVDVTPLMPGLVGIKCEENALKGLDGIRLKALVKLYAKKRSGPIFSESGEIQFKNNALSGIVIMNTESVIARGLVNKDYNASHLVINLLPEFSEDELVKLLMERFEIFKNYANIDFLIGIFSKMVAQNILRRSKIALDGYVQDLSNKDLERIAYNILNWEIAIKDIENFEHSQVTVGGVDLKEVNDCLELNKYPNIFIIGEALNIDGLCGGYNLEWAWISSMVAAGTIKKRIG